MNTRAVHFFLQMRAKERRVTLMGTKRMEFSMSDDGFIDRVKGTAKETAGKVTGDKDLEAEGKVDKTEGVIKDKVEDAKAGIKAVGDKIKDVFSGDKD